MKIYTLYMLSDRQKRREIEEILPTIATFFGILIFLLLIILFVVGPYMNTRNSYIKKLVGNS